MPYRKSSIKPTWVEEGLIERKGGGGGGLLLNLEKTMVSVFPKDLEIKVDKLKYKKVGGHAADDKKQIQTSSW